MNAVLCYNSDQVVDNVWSKKKQQKLNVLQSLIYKHVFRFAATFRVTHVGRKITAPARLQETRGRSKGRCTLPKQSSTELH